jgi:hypothetical protein
MRDYLDPGISNLKNLEKLTLDHLRVVKHPEDIEIYEIIPSSLKYCELINCIIDSGASIISRIPEKNNLKVSTIIFINFMVVINV